ncbi:MAG: helix-turn-helix domain-containing protein [Actinomycetota bacterium]
MSRGSGDEDAYDHRYPDDDGLRITTLEALFEFHASSHGPDDGATTGPCIDIERPHRLAFFTLILVADGVGVHEIDFEPHEYRPGSLLITSMTQVQRFVINDDTRGHLIQFTEPFLLRNLGRLDANLIDVLYNYELRSPIADATADNHLAGAINELADELAGPDRADREEMLHLLLKRVILAAGRLVDRIGAAPRADTNLGWSALFFEFRQLVEEGYWRSRSAQSYALRLGVSYKHLNGVCKATVGRSAKTYIDDAVILEAKRRLAIDDTPVSRLASDLGFDEPGNFTKFFTKRVGSTPTQFRETLVSGVPDQALRGVTTGSIRHKRHYAAFAKAGPRPISGTRVHARVR